MYMYTRSTSDARRGDGAQCMLLITVGTQDVSPFRWSIQSGAIHAATGILDHDSKLLDGLICLQDDFTQR